MLVDLKWHLTSTKNDLIIVISVVHQHEDV